MMDGVKLEGQLKELVEQFGGTADPQQSRLAMLAAQAEDSRKNLKQAVDSLQESIDYLRIYIKYQLFDLEATRRENEYLRRMLEEKEV